MLLIFHPAHVYAFSSFSGFFSALTKERCSSILAFPICFHLTLRAVGFSFAPRERNHCEEPFDFPSSMCEIRHTPRDVFDIIYFEGNHYTAGSPKRSSYVAERPRKRQNKFTNSFYQFKFNLFVLGAGRRLSQRNYRLLAVVSLSGSVGEINCSQGIFTYTQGQKHVTLNPVTCNSFPWNKA